MIFRKTNYRINFFSFLFQFFFFFFLWSNFFTSLYAQNNLQQSEKQKMFHDMELSVLTASPGGILFNSWGHTLLLIQNKAFKTDVAIDYGRFIFDPFFLVHFFKGEATYYVGSNSLQSELQRFESEGRFVYKQKLHLTIEQKENIMKQITHDMLSENRRFVYHHFTQNCTTKIRDLLDKNLDYALSSVLSQEDSKMSFREQGVHKINISPWVKIPLHIFLGLHTDKRMSVYQAMFLPKNFMQRLDESRNRLKNLYGYEVVEPIETIVYPFGNTDAKEKDFLQHNNYTLTWIFIFLALFFLLLFYGFELYKRKYKITNIFFLFWGILSSLVGFIILYTNIVAVQPELQANLNLLIFNPLNFVFVFWYFYFGKFGKKEKRSKQTYLVLVSAFFPVFSVVLRLFFWLPFPSFWQPTEYFSLYVLSFYALFFRFQVFLQK